MHYVKPSFNPFYAVLSLFPFSFPIPLKSSIFIFVPHNIYPCRYWTRIRLHASPVAIRCFCCLPCNHCSNGHEFLKKFGILVKGHVLRTAVPLCETMRLPRMATARSMRRFEHRSIIFDPLRESIIGILLQDHFHFSLI